MVCIFVHTRHTLSILVPPQDRTPSSSYTFHRHAYTIDNAGGHSFPLNYRLYVFKWLVICIFIKEREARPACHQNFFPYTCTSVPVHLSTSTTYSLPSILLLFHVYLCVILSFSKNIIHFNFISYIIMECDLIQNSIRINIIFI